MALPISVVMSLLAAFGAAHAADAMAMDAPAGSPPPALVPVPAAVCDSATAHIIIHDDGIAESGLGWEPTVLAGRLANRFTPTAYPARIDMICAAIMTAADTTSFQLNLVVYDDDGPNGGPGTLLAAKTVLAYPKLVSQLPIDPVFESFDVTDMNLGAVGSGSVYVSLEWDATTRSDVFIAMDEVPPEPIEGGYQRAGDGPWVSIPTVHPRYRTLYIRATMPPAVPSAPSLRTTFAPAHINAGQVSALTIILNNFSQPSAAVLSHDLVDVLPPGLVIASAPNASTNCANGVLTAVAGAGSARLAAGASIPGSGNCSIRMDVTSAANGLYTNTIPVGALQTQHGGNPDAATAELLVGPAFPTPYCASTFVRGVSPVTRVVFADIDNASSVDSTRAHEDFTARIGHVVTGQIRRIAVEGHTGTGPNLVVSYVDWNQDTVFDERSERVVVGNLVGSNGTDGVQVAMDMHIPLDAMPGATRMRVIKQSNVDTYACYNEWFGQAEDYTLMVARPDAIFCSAFDAGDDGQCAQGGGG